MKRTHWICLVLLVGLTSVAWPSDARAGVMAGVDGIWVPAATLDAAGEGDVPASHQLDSFGLGVHGTMGVGPVDLGLKVNYFDTGVEVAGFEGRQNELNINALGRFGIPGIGLAVLGEAGLATNTKFSGVGYDLGLGGEYSLFSVGPVAINTGAMGQWVTLPAKTNNNETTLKSFRFLLHLGVDVGF
jgi:hypothetical protein